MPTTTLTRMSPNYCNDGMRTISNSSNKSSSMPIFQIPLVLGDVGAAPNTLAIIEAFNDQNQFPAVTTVWATDGIISELKGLYEEYNTFAAIPRPLKAAPDAKTWAGVQLWLWWLPPTSFATGSDDTRTVCQSRTITIWNTMVSAYRASEVLEVLPDMEPELWEHIFTFLKHGQQPTSAAHR